MIQSVSVADRPHYAVIDDRALHIIAMDGDMMVHKKVRFNGEQYWLHSSPYGFNLSPLDHYTDNGELLADSFNDISYACIFDGNNIMRFGEVIGSINDLIDVSDNG